MIGVIVGARGLGVELDRATARKIVALIGDDALGAPIARGAGRIERAVPGIGIEGAGIVVHVEAGVAPAAGKTDAQALIDRQVEAGEDGAGLEAGAEAAIDAVIIGPAAGTVHPDEVGLRDRAGGDGRLGGKVGVAALDHAVEAGEGDSSEGPGCPA